MIKAGCDVWIREPQTDERNLRHSAVIELDSEGFVVEIDDHRIDLNSGDEIIIYFDDSGEFMQQVVRIGEIVQETPCLTVALIPVGDATSAESREQHRVSTISTEIHADIEGETRCMVQDVSATGLAVVSTESHEIGATLDISISFGGDFFCGRVCVQSVHELRPGRLRYGLRALVTDLHSSDLLDGLRQIHHEIQSGHAKRS